MKPIRELLKPRGLALPATLVMLAAVVTAAVTYPRWLPRAKGLSTAEKELGHDHTGHDHQGPA